MEMWFSELHTSNVKLSMRIEKQLFSGNSDCQRIDVLESVEFGKFLALDGDILFSEKDEFIYDEMVTPPGHLKSLDTKTKQPLRGIIIQNYQVFM